MALYIIKALPQGRNTANIKGSQVKVYQDRLTAYDAARTIATSEARNKGGGGNSKLGVFKLDGIIEAEVRVDVHCDFAVSEDAPSGVIITDGEDE